MAERDTRVVWPTTGGDGTPLPAAPTVLRLPERGPAHGRRRKRGVGGALSAAEAAPAGCRAGRGGQSWRGTGVAVIGEYRLPTMGMSARHLTVPSWRGSLGRGVAAAVQCVRAGSSREETEGRGLVKGHGRPSQAVARPSLLSLSFHVNCILGTADCTALHYCSYGDPTARSRGDKTCDASVTHPLTSHIRELSSTGPSAST